MEIDNNPIVHALREYSNKGISNHTPELMVSVMNEFSILFTGQARFGIPYTLDELSKLKPGTKLMMYYMGDFVEAYTVPNPQITPRENSKINGRLIVRLNERHEVFNFNYAMFPLP